MSTAPAPLPSAFDGFFDDDLATTDPDIAAAVRGELGRQQHQIELIASENFTWPSWHAARAPG